MVNLQVVSQSPIREGDDVTLKCQADGNPPPTSFNFNIKVRDHWPCPQQLYQSFISRVLLSALYPSLQVNYTIPLSLSRHLQGKKVTVMDKNIYTLTGVTRDDSGVYKCSLLDNEVMESTQIVTVSCEWEKDALFFSISLPSLPKGTYTLGKDLMERLTDMERSFSGFGKSRVSLKPSYNTENWSSKCIL